MKLIVGAGEPLVGRLLLVNALAMQCRSVKLCRNPRCPACGTREITRLISSITRSSAGPGRLTGTRQVPVIAPAELRVRLRRGDDIDPIDVRDPHEWEIARLNGARLAPLSSFADALSTLDSPHDGRVLQEWGTQCEGGAASAGSRVQPCLEPCWRDPALEQGDRSERTRY